MPERDAVLAPGCVPITYGALWVRTIETVRRLRSAGIGRTDRVAVVLPDGIEAAMAIIAVMTGAVCVPLNPGFAADEWRRYLGDLRVLALLTRPTIQSACRCVAQDLGIRIIDVPPLTVAGPDALSLNESTSGSVGADFASSADDALMLLTSGSTSRPKTVPLTHAAICQSAFNVGAALSLRPEDRLLSVLPLYHGHGLISGVLAALAAGSSVVCTGDFEPDAFFEWLTQFRPTWYTGVPAIHRAVLAAADRNAFSAYSSSLRLIRSASSTLPSKLLRDLERLFGVPVIDTYGMTEAATQIAANPLERRKPGSVGKAAGPEIAILDSEGRVLPAGERGEIALRGSTITRGYDNDAAATATAFRDGWFRTGDLGYLDGDGSLFIVGRIKDVIKRGGQQVAPAEVEEALLSHADVTEAAVFSVPHKRLGEDVAAAVVLRPGAKINAQDLRNIARERLAAFKVPKFIRIVPDIPKGPAGKIKRSELAGLLLAGGPGPQTESAGNLVRPGSELHRQLAGLWAGCLEVDQVGIDQDVFALGADSLTVAEMISHLRARFGVEFSFEDMLEMPTVAVLAARVASPRQGASPGSRSLCDAPIEIRPLEEDGRREVSIIQEQVLRFERDVPGLPRFNRFLGYRIRGRVNVEALKRSFAEVLRRHESLRAGFTWVDGQPVAVISPAAAIKSPLVVENLAPSGPAGNDRAKGLLLNMAKLEAAQEALTPIDVTRASLLRARLLRCGADDHALLLTVHEMIADGWSIGIFMEELSRLYAAFAAGCPAQLPEPGPGFFDFARWQRQWSKSGAAADEFAYWRQRLQGASPVFAAAGDADEASPPARVGQQPLHLGNDLIARLGALARSRGATLFMALLAGFKALLLARSGRNDICVATAMANRARPGTERIVGPVANTTMIRTRIDPDLSFEEALVRVRESVLGAYSRQDLPFDILAARLASEADLDPAALVQVVFILQNAFRRLPRLPEVTVRSFAYREGPPIFPIMKNWLTVALKETSRGITGSYRYRKDLLQPKTVQTWAADYKALLTKAASTPEISVRRLADEILVWRI